jgi:hypothetical protein
MMFCVAILVILGFVFLNRQSRNAEEAIVSQKSAKPTTTIDNEVTSPTKVDDVVIDYESEENENGGEHDETEDVWTPSDLDLSNVDRSNAEAVATRWACAYAASVSNENSTAFTARLSSLMTPEAVTKLSALRVTPDEGRTDSRFLVAAETKPGTWRVSCGTYSYNKDGKLTNEDTLTPTWVRLSEANGTFSVSDFAVGSVGFE